MAAELNDVLMEEELLPLPEAVGNHPSSVESTILRVLGGEVEAFEELMALTEAKVLAVAWRILGDREQAKDAAQEVFLRVYRSLNRYRLGENFQSWMYRITVNVCYDLVRKRGPAPAPEFFLEGHTHSGSEHAENLVLLNERRAMVLQALGTLSPAERSALVLRDLEGLSTQEVAQTLGVRAVTVRSQISSARSKMQVFCARLMGGRP